MTSLTREQQTPTNIEVDLKQGEVRITWADGYRSVYSLEHLRKICPCAECNEQRRNQDPLRVLKPDQAAARGELRRDRPVEKVGNYALQFFWADGHSTGIYGYDLLRQASPET
ncbi:MAG: gamma-butyrobetaine hydroxylase-like domain-containing protein [Anaerolineae bacterium]